ncbi:cation diffusion facilitator family transporter [Oculatella sp. LEGE 06141]|uniref:cation diffusion facilitator family transporter n=1 Tax=Oculatella sp. LEGE 06141 TaxID=1828648 RepID=UPI001881819A|nr:cation diffusion facilitator family transporter [Oculatella sp. LEGE 06141]MBE9178888.1 cation diffusion facilitator family transporter [Oculatella sp. LEGE 06141]
MTEARNRRRASFQLLLVTLWITLLVLAVKIWAGWATRSLSLLADALHTLIDSFSIGLSLLAVTSAPRPIGREVWSYGKRETAGVLLLVAFLGFSGFNLLNLSVEQLQAATQNQPLPFPTQIDLPLVQLLGVAVAINTCLVLFERYESRVLESSALRLNADHMLRDTWLTIVVLVGLVGVSQGFVWLDPMMAIALVGLTVISLWRVLNWQLPLLVQQVAIAPESLAQIAYQVEGVTQCHHVRSRGLVGRQVLVEMHLILHPEFMSAANLIAERVEGAIRERYGPVQVKIHADTEANRLEQSRRLNISAMKSKRSQRGLS